MGRFAAPTAAKTRPADTTAYTSGDLVANSVTAGSVTPFVFALTTLRGAEAGRVRNARLQKSAASVTNATFRLHLFDRAKTVTNGDNGALAFDSYDGYVASIDIDLATGATALAGGPVTKFSADLTASFHGRDGNLYGYLEARGAYTPASGEVFVVALSVES